MPKGRVLSPAEREEIVRMHEAGASGREIAKKLTRSKTVVLNFLKNPAQYAQIKRSGRKRALSGEDERRLYAALFQQRSNSSTMNPAECSVVGAQDQSVAHGYTQASGADPATVTTDKQTATMATAPAQGEGLLLLQQRQQNYPAGNQDMKRSAEQIRKEFNVPLSTRRIQQLLSEWRREAQRAQERQQIAPSQPPERPVAEVKASNTNASGAAITVVIAQAVSAEPTTEQPSAHEGEPEAVAEADTPLDQQLYHAAPAPTEPSLSAATAEPVEADPAPEVPETSASATEGSAVEASPSDTADIAV
ncbi:hypothetical protein Gpo141_00002277 [Globisporangium polare]